MTHRNKVLAALGLASILGSASLEPAHAAGIFQGNGILFSAVGSTGQIDSRSAALAKTSKANLSINASGTVVARYSVPPSTELASANGVFNLMATFVDPGAGAAVDISLIEVEIGGPGEAASSTPARTRLLLSSADNATPGMATHCVADDGSLQFDFENKVYYIQVVLSWDSAAQSLPPSLRAVELGVYSTACRQ